MVAVAAGTFRRWAGAVVGGGGRAYPPPPPPDPCSVDPNSYDCTSLLPPAQVCLTPATKQRIADNVKRAAGSTTSYGGLLGQIALVQKIQSIVNNTSKVDFYEKHAVEIIGKDWRLFSGNDFNAYDTAVRLGPALGPASEVFVVESNGFQVYLVPGQGLLNSGIGSALNPAIGSQFMFSVYNAANNQLITAFPVNTLQEAIKQATRTISDVLNLPGGMTAFDSDSPSAPMC